MTYRSPVRVSDRHTFDTLIDARTPAEFDLDHLPGAINCPVLDNEERAIVGTLYKQQGAFEARRVGAAFVAANLAQHLRTVLADRPQRWRPLVYCWRGGLRSGSMVQWLRLVGWDAQQLGGGYKSWRRHVMAQIEALVPHLRLQVICGPTGSAKTRVLQALEAQGAQVLDLEALACHRGSVLGALPGREQPSQTAFETQLVHALEALDLQRPVFIEAESARIGRINIPQSLVGRLRAGVCLEICTHRSARLDFLLRDYAHWGQDGAHLAALLGVFKELHSRQTIERWQQWACEAALAPLFAELIDLHYDPLYERSQRKHLLAWDARQRLDVPDLSDQSITAVAEQIMALSASL